VALFLISMIVPHQKRRRRAANPRNRLAGCTLSTILASAQHRDEATVVQN
jgi:hypothetical protein